MAIQFVESKVYDAASGQDDDLSGLQESKSRLLLAPQVPSRDQVRKTRINSRHGHTKQDSQGNHLLPCCDESSAHGDQAEAESNEGEPSPWAESADCNCTWKLEGNARDCEDEDADTIPIAGEV